ncbi:MAG: Putative aminopeptidase YsdC [Desulfovibrio sp.]
MVTAKQTLKDLFKELGAINAVPGHEYHVIGTILEKVKPHADEVTVDAIGNVYAIKKGSGEGPAFMVMAHMDEIGLIIKNILPDGFLLFEKLGGVHDTLLPGRKFYIGPDKIPGVVGVKPGHLQTPQEASSVRAAAQCYIDIGASSREEVEKLGIRVGDLAVWDGPYTEMANPDLICAKAADDRLGCAVLIELLRSVKSSDFAGTLQVVFSVREEMGLFGAPVAVNNLKPDYAVAIDTIPAGDTPDVNTAKELPICLGEGPGLPVASGVGYLFASIAHPAVVAMLEDYAAKSMVNLQRMTLSSTGYATDADKIAYSGKGVATATLAIPRRYSHSPIELFNINDALDVLTVLHAMVKGNAQADYRFYKG